MKQKSNTWRSLSIPYNPQLQDTLLQQYHAAQFLAMAGHHLVPQRADDSNTSMEYLPEKELLAGQEIKDGKRLALRLHDLTLGILQNNILLPHSIELIGLTRSDAFNKLIYLLNSVDIDTNILSINLHYDIPDHELIHEATFKHIEARNIEEQSRYRHNARFILKQLKADYPRAEEIRIWPHHFDTGSFIPVAMDDQGEVTRSMGIGWAIPDGMVNEPYFYLSIWSKDPLEFPKNMPSLPSGSWMNPVWNGGILRLSEILKYDSPGDQYNTVWSFYKTGIGILEKLLQPKILQAKNSST